MVSPNNLKDRIFFFLAKRKQKLIITFSSEFSWNRILFFTRKKTPKKNNLVNQWNFFFSGNKIKIFGFYREYVGVFGVFFCPPLI